MNLAVFTAKSLAIVRIIRPLNAFLAVLGVCIGAFMVAGESLWTQGLSSKLALALGGIIGVSGAANALNDIYDLEIDRVNRPTRPLPQGDLSIQEAHWVWRIGIALSLITSLMLSLWHFIVVLVSATLLYFYSALWKRKPLIGNLIVSFVVSIAFVYGGWAVGTSPKLWVMVGFSFLSTLIREICKDIEDVEGDSIVASQTLPLWIGITTTQKIVFGLLTLLILLVPIPYFMYDFSGWYLIAMLAVGVICLVTLWHLFQTTPETEGARIASGLMKWMMVFGMLAFLA